MNNLILIFGAFIIICSTVKFISCQEYEDSEENFKDKDGETDSENNSSSSSSEEYQYDIHGAYAYGYGKGPPSLSKGFSTTTTAPGPSNCFCGRSNVNRRIVGGQTSLNHVWPWMAAIANTSAINVDTDTSGGLMNTTSKFVIEGKTTIFCGGSIINDRNILTAGHCAKAILDNGFEKFRVIVGTNKVYGVSPFRKVLRIKSARIHPKYVTPDTGSIMFDAAILELETTLTFSTNILPICLGQAGSPYVNRIATVSGWGNTIGGSEGNYRPSNFLLDVNVQVISNSICNDTYATAEGSPTGVSPSMMCAYGEGKDSCSGDSGGPLFLKKSSSSQAYKQIGIVSYGESCATNYPGVYTRVQKILSWIMAFTKDANYCRDSFTP